MTSRLQWPPKAESIKLLGYVHEIDGKDSPRDGGLSIQLGGNTYYIFGDTFCFDNKKSFVGLTNNTIAQCPNTRKPLESRFLYQNHGKPGLVREFFPYTEKEKAFNDAHLKKERRRVCLWSFGGLIEDTPECGKGWMFFEGQQTHGANAEKSWGCGLCRVTLEADGNVVARRIAEPYLWKPDEPAFGSHSTFKDTDGMIYLLGGGGGGGLNSLTNYLARLPAGADITQRSAYSFLSKNGHWISHFKDQSELKPILPDTAQGSLLKPSFAPPGKPYMYMGVGWWMKSKFYVAAAPKMEGPWELVQVATAGSLNKVSRYQYCIYPHEWSWDAAKGELFVSWSEDGPGRVIGASVKFALQEKTG